VERLGTTYDSLRFLDVLHAKQKLSVEVAQIDRVEVHQVDLTEAHQDEVLEELASDTAGTDEEYAGL